MNPSTAFGAVLADELARCGLREAVVAPGSRSAPLAMAFDELDRAGRVRLHVRIDERAAAFTALGLAKASGRPVAVVCTSGTAAANFHPAVIEADESAVPLLVLTADRPPELRGTGASQTVDQIKLYGSAARWYAESGVPERLPGMAGYWRSLACRAWAHAAGDLGARPGPVHLNIPLRDPLVPDAQPATPRPVLAPALPAASSGPHAPSGPHASPENAAASDRSRLAAADWPDTLDGRPDGAPWTRVGGTAGVAVPLELPWAERGVVVCGDGDYDAAPLVELAEQAGWPVLAEPSSGARRGPNALVSYQYLLASPEFMAAHRPTVIVSAGRPGLSRPQSALLRLAREVASAHPGSAGTGSGDTGSVDAATGAAPSVRQVVIAQEPGMWADPQRAATDVALAVRLTGAPDRAPARGAAAGRWLEDWRTADAAATTAATAVLETWRGGEPSEPEVARELVAALPKGALLWCGNSLSVRDIDLALSPGTDARVMASRGASGIDGTFSTAAGAALAHAADHPGAVAFALIGDLSLLHDAAGLSIGPAEPRPDLCVVVVNNDGGGIFEGLEPARFGGGVSGRPQASQQPSRPSAAQAGGPPGGPAEAPVRPGEPHPLTVFERTFGTPHGASIEHLAAAFGIPCTLAERPGEIAKAVAATVPGSGPRIVEARTSRAPNADLRARMRAAALAALATLAAPAASAG